MEEKDRGFYDKIRDAVNAYVLHDPNAQAVTAFEREKKMKTVDDKTLAMFQESAEAGHPFSCFNLGRCYETGNGVEKDLEKAYEWYRKAAVGGDVNAWLALAKMFDTGTYVDKDPKEAAMWLSRAADKNHPIAKIGMGQKYSRGDGVEKDPEKALQYFKEAKELEPGIGSYILGEAIGDGIGCEKNYEEAFHLFEEAHEHKFALGTYNLGMMLEMGLGCEKDEKKGFELIRQAADEGIPEAMYRIAFHYREGTSEAVQSDKTAFDYFKKAADKGFAPAYVETGLCYENGAGVEMNKEEAFRCYEKGAQAGLHTAIVCLAVCYRAGIGCNIDEDKSIELLERAVLIGNTRAYHLLASALFEKNPYDERAINLEMVASRAGFARSSLFLGGYFLQKGEAGPDTDRASHYFRLAAKEGSPDAMFELADILDTEENRENEEIQKEIWELYEGSADAGHPLAANKMALRYKDPSERASSGDYYPAVDPELSEEERRKKEVHYISIAATGGIPSACYEVAERSFWGDGLKVDIRSAKGLYHYCADELDNRSLLARYAFCCILTSMEFIYGKVGDNDPAIKDLIESERARLVREDQTWQEGMDLLETLAKENIPDAVMFLPLAKALSYGEKTDLSSEEDQKMLEYIDDLPDNREKYYIQGVMKAILKPKDVMEPINYLRYARSSLRACNVDQILGNLYLSLSRKVKFRSKEEVMVIENAFTGWSTTLQKDELARLRDQMRNQSKESIWSENTTWSRKKAKPVEILNSASALYKEAYANGETNDLRPYNRVYDEITDRKMLLLIPAVLVLGFLVALLGTIMKLGWDMGMTEMNGGTGKDVPWKKDLMTFLDIFVWVLLAVIVVYVAIYAVLEVKKGKRKARLEKLMKEKAAKKEQK